MAKLKLIQKPPPSTKHEPRDRFSDLATTVFTAPKTAVDELEQRWKRANKKTRTKRAAGRIIGTTR